MDRAAQVELQRWPLKNRCLYVANILNMDVEQVRSLPEAQVNALYVQAFNSRHPVEVYIIQSTIGYWSGACCTSIEPLAFIRARTAGEALQIAQDLGVKGRGTLSAEVFAGDVAKCPWIKVRNF